MYRFVLSTAFLSIFLFSTASRAQTRVLVHLADVKTIYVDNDAFKVVSSPCAQTAGRYVLTCPQDVAKRLDFLVALKRWLGKSGFTVVDNKDDAEAILDGTLAINDYYRPGRDIFPYPGRHRDHGKNDKDRKGNSHHYSHINTAGSWEKRWTVTASIVNQKNRRFWTLGSWYPDISYAGKQPKIEGKRLAKAVLYDFKHYK